MLSPFHGEVVKHLYLMRVGPDIKEVRGDAGHCITRRGRTSTGARLEERFRKPVAISVGNIRLKDV
jgi:hypothetical protein